MMSALDDLYHPTKDISGGGGIGYGDSTNLLMHWSVKDLKAKKFAFVNMFGRSGIST